MPPPDPRPEPPPRRDDAHLWDMLQAALEVREFVAGRTWDDYTRDKMLRRSVEIIGEACRRVSAAFREAHPDIPWPKIAGQRHRLAHEYDKIEDATIWRVATIHIPELIRLLTPLIPPPAQDLP